VGLKFLLDTHALLWWWTDDSRLPDAARSAIADRDNSVLVSAAEGFETYVARSSIGLLAITATHARSAGMLEGPHRDPFDRMLIAQAREATLVIVSADRLLRDYGATVLWDG